MFECLADRSAVFMLAFVGMFIGAGCQTTNDSGGSHAMHAGSGSGAEVSTKVSALLDEYTQALLNKDVAALDRIWADDLTFVNMRGELLSKRNRMDNIKTGATTFKSIKLTDKQVRTYGETAVATFKVALEAQYSAQEGSGDYRVTTVWARPKGTWQMVSVQMTRITQ